MSYGLPHCARMDHHEGGATDRVRRFIFERLPVRGHWVRLESAWRELRAHGHYPQPVERLPIPSIRVAARRLAQPEP